MHIIVGDLVQIIKGKDRPQTAEDRKQPSGKVLKVDRAKGRVIVEGKNLVWKHLRKSEQRPQGGRVQREAFLPVANVLPFNTKSSKAERIHFKVVDGKKARYFKSTGQVFKSGEPIQ
ncbi:50S ribosomal protein L24 [bacterium]|nr:MAG: 50S ribosomal protein L24 [bacterium]RIK64929.1 MAG: 50S ribosomal protein L24 [Planctomycetota bacterium]